MILMRRHLILGLFSSLLAGNISKVYAGNCGVWQETALTKETKTITLDHPKLKTLNEVLTQRIMKSMYRLELKLAGAVFGYCSGVAISDDLLLTVGHCTEGDPAIYAVQSSQQSNNPVEFELETVMSENDAHGVPIEPLRYLLRDPTRKKGSFRQDNAVLKIKGDEKFASYIRPFSEVDLNQIDKQRWYGLFGYKNGQDFIYTPVTDLDYEDYLEWMDATQKNLEYAEHNARISLKQHQKVTEEWQKKWRDARDPKNPFDVPDFSQEEIQSHRMTVRQAFQQRQPGERPKLTKPESTMFSFCADTTKGQSGSPIITLVEGKLRIVGLLSMSSPEITDKNAANESEVDLNFLNAAGFDLRNVVDELPYGVYFRWNGW